MIVFQKFKIIFLFYFSNRTKNDENGNLQITKAVGCINSVFFKENFPKNFLGTFGHTV
jgi:hypothetical protein